MPTIHLETRIKADIQICFDLSRSIDLHKIATAKTKETAIAGVTSGLIGLNETVTWQAFHLGFKQRLTSVITAFDSPHHFRDEQLKGIFHSFQHDHIFKQESDCVLMIDNFKYRSPLGILGRIADSLFLKKYLEGFLLERNNIIKSYAESDRWKTLL